MGNEILDDSAQKPKVDDQLGITQERIPKDSSILTTGIIALPFSLGLIGIILSIITLVNASKALQTYNSDPNRYLESSLKKVKAGKVCAIVSLSLLVVGTLVILAIAAS